MTHVPKAELPEFVRNTLTALRLHWNKNRAVIIALEGDLGSGKTTFVQQLARQFEITDVVQSPTYVLMKSYDLPSTRTRFGELRRFKKLVHIDAYRLENAAQFAALKPEQFLNNPSVVVAIEWPERVRGALPEPDLTVKFSSEGVGENERNIEVV
jgi:tRNA threonylcarbamoyladenosine biosynthesis protein TsaE